ncbi:MAG: hypothetical protein MAG795_01007 [Candidatus Woesearchaeota archaeon]|nr:hypothetical protein [Candidatus Woesearchaeota archaeon]
MKKKGVELTLNTIIIAAICIIVLIVVLAIFTNLFSGIGKDIDKLAKCKAMGKNTGSCVAENDENKNCMPGFGGCKPNQFCCWSG